MKNVLILGAGQLGSRHLQALKSVSDPLSIQVYDISPDSLKIAQERFDGISGVGHSAEYISTIDKLKPEFDFVINASSSKSRRNLIESLLSRSKVKFLLMEKILFPNSDDYPTIEKLVSARGTKAWVNCCMRMMPTYQKIKEELQGKPVHMTMTGSKFGLITNAIHYLDYMAWVSDSTTFTLDTTALDKEPTPSRHPGCVDLTGTLIAKFPNGNTASITCFKNGSLPVVTEFHSPQNRILVKESERKVLSASESTQWQWSETDAVMPYQSSLTGTLAKELFTRSDCVLPTLKDSTQIHLSMLEPLAQFLDKNSIKSELKYPFS